VYQVDRNDRGFDLFVHKSIWYAIPTGTGPLDPVAAAHGLYPFLLPGDCEYAVRKQLDIIRGLSRLPPPPGQWERLRRDVFSEPLHQLPRRAWRKVRGRLARA
jgi:hypothetical protein